MEEKLTVFQVKYYDAKEKVYKESLVRSLGTAEKIMEKVFNEGSMYVNVQLIKIEN